MKFYNSATGKTSEISRLEWLCRKMDAMSRWQALRAIGHSKITLLTVLTPVVGYLIIFNTKYEIFQEGWKVSWFYLGTVLFSAGTLMYSFWCPGECKKYDTAVEYTNTESEFFSANPHIIIKMIERKIHLKNWPSHIIINQNYIDHLIDTTRKAKRYDETKAAVISLMDEYWHTISPSHPNMRLACLSCYALGSFLIFMPGLWTALDVLGRLFLFSV